MNQISTAIASTTKTVIENRGRSKKIKVGQVAESPWDNIFSIINITCVNSRVNQSLIVIVKKIWEKL